MTERDPFLYVEDILTSVNALEKYTQGITSWEEFKKNNMVFDAVVRNFEIIGEAVRNLVLVLKVDEEKMPWSQIISLRNRIAHEYFNIDAGIIWKTVEHDLPILKRYVERLKDDLKRQNLGRVGGGGAGE